MTTMADRCKEDLMDLCSCSRAKAIYYCKDKSCYAYKS